MKKKFLFVKVQKLTVVGPEKKHLNKVRDALFLIKKTDKKEYEKVLSRIKMIFITNRNGFTNEFFMPEKIWFANISVIKNNDINWLASLIIHEAFHATQFKNGKYVTPLGEKMEKPALKVQNRFLKKTADASGKHDIVSVKNNIYWGKMNEDTASSAYFRSLLRLFEQKKLKLIKSRN